ncbi:MAG: hypothetical protein FJX67_17085, partial [Alphaproteobacteria bacterium]|nr:hypothetical protein [Alphaproteobacteria bacterium]
MSRCATVRSRHVSSRRPCASVRSALRMRLESRIDMAEENEPGKGKLLTLSRPGRLELKKTVDAGQVRQSFSHGRSKAVTVEVRRKRTFTQTADGSMTEVKKTPDAVESAGQAAARSEAAERAAMAEAATKALGLRTLTEEEKALRAKVLQDSILAQSEADIAAALAQAEQEARREIEVREEAARAALEKTRRLEEEEARKAAE